MTRAEEGFRAAVQEAARGRGPLAALRREAAEQFLARGLPTRRDEEWRFTDVGRLAAHAYAPAPPGDRAAAERFVRFAADGDAVRLVFVNGRFEPSLSTVGGLPRGAFAGSLAEALASGRAGAHEHLGKVARLDGHPFAALNTALFEDGAYVELPAGERVAEAIHLLFVATCPGQPAASHPRALVVAGRGSEAALIESHFGCAEELYLASSLTEVVLEDGAVLEHHRLQEEGARSFHLDHLFVRQGRGTRFASRGVALGAAFGRSEIEAVMAGAGAECRLDGLYLASGEQQIDNVVVVRHAAPNGISRERYKGILDGAARAVFSGRVRVDPGAQKTDGYQLSSTLLLSDDAVVDTKPQLEIFADDVKCGHGGTVGQLDENALFYLQSRGIAREEARSLLTYAFASELVEEVRPLALRRRVQARVVAHVPGATKLLEAA